MTYGYVVILGYDMFGNDIFVNREKELELLEKYYKQCSELGVNCGILVYGWRRIGKTTLIKKFVEKNNGVYISCAWVSDPRTLLRYILEILKDIAPRDFLERYKLALNDDLMLVLRSALEIFCHPEVYERKIIVVLDEFQFLVEKLAYRIARETRKKKPVVKSDILWLIRDLIETKKAFWVLLTSMGWAKIHEEYFDESKGEKPLSGILIKMKISPLDKQSSIELIRKLNPYISREISEEIYYLSGGIPRIMEVIAPNYRENTTLLGTVIKLVKNGQFDEIFENIIKFVAEVAKRDYSTLIEVLKALEGEEPPEQIARRLNLDRVSTYNILEDLTKMEILKKRKIRGRVYYSHQYPLLQVWLKLRITPIKKITSILITELGITAEAYVREILKEYMAQKRPLELYDDDKGTYLAGTVENLKITIKKVLSHRETQKFLRTKNADTIIIDKNNEPWLIEIKARIGSITKDDIKKLAKVAEKNSIKNKILMQVGQGEIEPKAVSEAIRTGIIIVTRQGVKLMAKKINYPSI